MSQIQELLTSVLPQKTKESIASRGAAAELKGTTITMTMDVSGKHFSYTLTDGTTMTVAEEKNPKAMVAIRVSEADLTKMVQKNELDIIQMVMTELDKGKYETLRRLNGTFKAELSNDDGSKYQIEVTFNGANEPNAIFRMKTSDSAAMMRKEENPVNLFMAGAMQIEGDMQFSMATQPLFV
jgi:putative sterol carrier protein